MNVRNAACISLGLAASVVFLGCTTSPPVSTADVGKNSQGDDRTDLTAAYAQRLATGERIFTLDPQASQVRIYAFRGGRATKVGHNHVLSAPHFVGYFHLPPEGTVKAGFDLEFRLDQLELDNPEYRSRLGGAFSSQITTADVDSTRAHMLGGENLQADQFPYVRIHSLQIVGESPKFAANVGIAMHGQRHEMWVPLRVEGLPDRLSVSGSFVLRQTDFGVHPFSVMGGLLAIEDAVVVEFELVGMQATTARR